jgi:NAD/NADP transhydrogenase alpha subunit
MLVIRVAVQGRQRADRWWPRRWVATMKPGSVIVDIASDAGGNSRR